MSIEMVGRKDILAYEKNIDRKIFLPTIIITSTKIDFPATFVSWAETVFTNEEIFVDKKKFLLTLNLSAEV